MKVGRHCAFVDELWLFVSFRHPESASRPLKRTLLKFYRIFRSTVYAHVLLFYGATISGTSLLR